MLSAGTSLGPYEILAPLGAGGMGEVYRARDARLGREVAVKVLPAHLAATAELRARFEREARTISQLNHPHICVLHDIGREGEIDYLVMELLEGETLAHRLEKGPLPLSEVLTLGAQIADALDRAHRAGVVHRDLKPGNVMLGPSGAKLMDFGLARIGGLTPMEGSLADSPTLTRPLTTEGAIVGTFQYMAPEQLESKEADSRSDIWALGCVLYEMATGKKAFEGRSQASLIASIMSSEPPAITILQPLSPPALDHLVARCLAKDPADRWQSARDVRHELEWVKAAGSGAGGGTAAPGRGGAANPWAAGMAATIEGLRHRRRAAWILAGATAVAVVLIALMALLAPRWSRRSPPAELARFSVTPTGSGAIVTEATAAAISPDGRRLAFVVSDSTGTPRLWIRSLASLTAQPLAGTEQAFCPFWSPDGRFIAFFASGKLRKVTADGGPPQVICDAPSGRGGSWNQDGVIVFAPTAMGPLRRVPAEGGDTEEVARPDPARHETGLRFPLFLPDGRHFLYASLPRRDNNLDIYAGSLDSKDVKRVMTANSSPVYAEPGYLIFAIGDRLVAQRFEAGRLRLAGGPQPLGEIAPPTQFEGASLVSVSRNGVLAHAATTPPNSRLEWLDRAGRPLESIGLPAGSFGTPSLSPDDRRVTLSRFDSFVNADLWLIDLQRPIVTRLTFDGRVAAGGGTASGVVWSPDGRRVAFMYRRSGSYDIYQMSTGGEGRPEPLLEGGAVFKSPVAWSPDGKYLIFTQNEDPTGWDIWLLPMTGDRKPVPYVRTEFDEQSAAISPDGRWLAYESDETGTPEVYVSSFPTPGEKYRVSSSGGSGAQWSRNGRELIIWQLGTMYTTIGPLYSVAVETTPTFSAGPPRLLFTPRQDILGLTATGDLQRFLAAVPIEGAAPYSITVMLNWESALQR